MSECSSSSWPTRVAPPQESEPEPKPTSYLTQKKKDTKKRRRHKGKSGGGGGGGPAETTAVPVVLHSTPEPNNLISKLRQTKGLLLETFPIKDKSIVLSRVHNILISCTTEPQIKYLSPPTLLWTTELRDITNLLRLLLTTRREDLQKYQLFPYEIQVAHSHSIAIPWNSTEILMIITQSLTPGIDSYNFLQELVGPGGSFTLSELIFVPTMAAEAEGGEDEGEGGGKKRTLCTDPEFPLARIIYILTGALKSSKEVFLDAQAVTKFAPALNSATFREHEPALVIIALVPIVVELVEHYWVKHREHTEQGREFSKMAWEALLALVNAIPFHRMPERILSTFCNFANMVYLHEQRNVSEYTLRLITCLVKAENFKFDSIPAMIVIRKIDRTAYLLETTTPLFDGATFRYEGTQTLDFPVLDILVRCQPHFVHLSKGIWSRKELQSLITTTPQVIFQLMAVLANDFIEEFANTRLLFTELLLNYLNHARVVEVELLYEGRGMSEVDTIMDKSFFLTSMDYHLGCVQACALLIEQDSVYAQDVELATDIWKAVLESFKFLESLRSVGLMIRIFDVFAALSEPVFLHLTAKMRHRILGLVIKYGRLDMTKVDGHDKYVYGVRAKVGRVIANFCEFSSLMTQEVVFTEFGKLICEGVSTETVQVKNSFGWAIGKWSDALLAHWSTSTTLKDVKTGLAMISAVRTTCLEIPKMRYNGSRAAGNLLKWIPAESIDSAKMCEIQDVLRSLLKQIGSGTDYKVRWNAVHAVGCILDNETLVSYLSDSIMIEMIETLGKWVCRSQNYKERIQCASALGKLRRSWVQVNRLFPQIWLRLLQAVTNLPLEEPGMNMAVKLKTEVIGSLSKIVLSFQPVDIYYMKDVIVENKEALDKLFYPLKREVNEGTEALIRRCLDRLLSIHRTLAAGRPPPEISKMLFFLQDVFTIGCSTPAMMRLSFYEDYVSLDAKLLELGLPAFPI